MQINKLNGTLSRPKRRARFIGAGHDKSGPTFFMRIKLLISIIGPCGGVPQKQRKLVEMHAAVDIKGDAG